MKQRFRVAWRALCGRPVIANITVVSDGNIWFGKERYLTMIGNHIAVHAQTPTPPEAWLSVEEASLRQTFDLH